MFCICFLFKLAYSENFVPVVDNNTEKMTMNRVILSFKLDTTARSVKI